MTKYSGFLCAVLAIGLVSFDPYQAPTHKRVFPPQRHVHVAQKREVKINNCCGYPEYNISAAHEFLKDYNFAQKFCRKGVRILISGHPKCI